MLPLRSAGFATMLGGRPGPVNLDVPFNVFKEAADEDVVEPGEWRAGISSRSGGDPADRERAVELLRSARRPLIYVGHGVTLSEAGADLTTLAHRLRIPVIFSPNGFGTLDMADPLALGFVGRNGVFHANEAARTCDVLLALGVRFDDRSSSSWIPGYSFNIRRRASSTWTSTRGDRPNYPVHLGIVGDVRTVPAAPAGRARTGGGARALGAAREWRAQWEEFVARTGHEAEPIHPQRVVGRSAR
jgi:acetolactate synthase-1/2/3 large subunit